MRNRTVKDYFDEVVERNNCTLKHEQDATKLDSIEAGAQINKIESISVNGVPQPIVNKNIDLDVSVPSDTQRYYKFVLTESLDSLNMKLQLLIKEEDLSPILQTVNQTLGTSLASAEELVQLYGMITSGVLTSENYNYLVGVFHLIGMRNLIGNLNNIYVVSEGQITSVFKIIGTHPQVGLMLGNGYSAFTQNSPGGDIEFQIRFLSNSNLTITLVENQNLE